MSQVERHRQSEYTLNREINNVFLECIVRHSIHSQVRSGTERNRRHLIPLL